VPIGGSCPCGTEPPCNGLVECTPRCRNGEENLGGTKYVCSPGCRHSFLNRFLKVFSKGSPPNEPKPRARKLQPTENLVPSAHFSMGWATRGSALMRSSFLAHGRAQSTLHPQSMFIYVPCRVFTHHAR
jgi:hypothetical protein